ncbi:histone deacetylase family protein [Pseudohalocynthiibacter aestuariivivens]|jgi:acetoin utilization deacetylase AcuC-like enzyme|uniref:Histone deacetylase family protein n=1 Tax=Pseudohalocynthiibacter aestuariivivens TaxID=1591409 RepID=A0ABV5JHK1_9RHOB|nr:MULTISPECIES: histone deacetylase family protein [Pseudohalocynthiibacter]MBS9715352.1 histone deacetylase family protein [Pseudohalocynthiibacter aestuariivivens]MCK0102702.1 histone deacetylase family protein [Pseudohalocynthiibacter sp. F2068]
MTTLLYTHPDCDAHVNPTGHPEQVARLEYIKAALKDPKFSSLIRREAPLGQEADVLRCHPQHHIDRITDAVPTAGWVSLDGDTSMSPGSLNAAYRGVGANVDAVDSVVSGAAQNAFVACRPPGHHAETETAMGFCLFGNVSIAAKHALDHHKLARVAIIDFDVHHGNGTQDLLWNERRAMFASTHQMPLYPGSGYESERGAFGNVLNVPLAPNSGSAAMRAAYDNVVLPAVEEFAPELILISAGFDAHRRDPLANLNWERDDFRWVTERICDVADAVCQGRVVSTLEGGYDLDALAASVAAHVGVLMERAG